MAVGAHPDDAELYSGATLAKWIAAGCEAVLVVCSDGKAGSSDPNQRPAEVAAIRKREQEAAAMQLGVSHVEMFGMPDGGLRNSHDFRGEIVRAIRLHRPEVILTHDPYIHGRLLHPDHRVVGQVVQEAIFPYARDRLHYPEQTAAGLAPHKVRELLLWDSDEPNSVVDVSRFVSQKAAALVRHGSQLRGLFGDRDPAAELTTMAEEDAHNRQFEYGELFRRIIAPP